MNIEDTPHVSLPLNPRQPREDRVILDDIGIEAKFKQELNNPSVRTKSSVHSDTVQGEELFVDLVVQLDAAQKAAAFFENEAAGLYKRIDRVSWNFDKLAAANEELKAENDRLKEGGFWRSVGRFFWGEQGADL